MKINLLLICFTILLSNELIAQCSTQTLQSTSCVCKDGSTNCALLPDLNLSWWSLENDVDGPTEYSQTGNGENNGRLRITGSTPNIGHGSFTVLGSDRFVCGTDTLIGDPGTCPDGNPPRQLIVQRVYYKNDNGIMTYEDRWAGAMTYHPTHGHNHVDDWVVFTLRIEDGNDPNPLNWPIVGNGAKIGFCLMDFGSCSTYPNHCKDDNTTHNQGTTLYNSDFPNYGLGGGSYGCSPVIQGISSGWTDIYHEYLDGMWIDIPPGTCNGDYWIVGIVDPQNHFLEEDETNNWTAIPFTLTQQEVSSFQGEITYNTPLTFCQGDSVLLTATTGLGYEWNNNATTQSIYAKEPGEYFVSISSNCGNITTSPVIVEVTPKSENPTASDQAICAGETLTLTAEGIDIHWFDSNMTQIGTGTSLNVENVLTTTVFYAQEHSQESEVVERVGKEDNSGDGYFFNSTSSLVFDVMQERSLKSVKIYAESSGNVVVKLKNNLGQLITEKTVTVNEGENRVYLNFDLSVGTGFYLEASGENMPNLYRSTSNLAYPYVLENVIRITGPLSAYLNFYDWELVEMGQFCPSDFISINVLVDCALSIDEIDLTQFLTIYPNPASKILNIEMYLTESTSAKIELFNVIGASVLIKNIDKTLNIHEELDISMLQKGVYLVNVSVANKSYTKRLVVQ
jgi:hypothetical protein